jgi:short-subunit dehydrogenase/acyl dehydratase/acyl carrier protein
MPAGSDRRYEDFSVGNTIFFSRYFSRKDSELFSALSGDRSPLHHDAEYAAQTPFNELIMPMQLLTAPLSAVAGMYLPGHRSLCVSVRQQALRPARYDTEIFYSAKVTAKNDARSALTLRILIFDVDKILLDAEMIVQVRDDVGSEMAPPLDQNITVHSKSQGSVFITGATGMIGRNIALALARGKRDLLLLHRKDRLGEAEALRQRCMSFGVKADLVEGSLENPEELETIAKTVARQEGIRTLIHAASPPIQAGLQSLLAVNFSALQSLFHALRPGMLRHQQGVVLFIGSSAVQYNPEDWADYTAAKVAASHYVTALHNQYGHYGIAGWVLAPGFVRTPFSEEFRPLDASCLLPEQVAETGRAILEETYGTNGGYIWMEPEAIRHGRFGFYNNSSGTPVSADSLASPVADTPSTGSHPHQDDIATLVQTFFGLDSHSDLAETGLDQLPGWDSLRHIELMLFLEKSLNISIGSHEIDLTKRYQDLELLVTRKLAKKMENSGEWEE